MGDAEKKQSDCVKVALRCRPLSNKENGNNETSIVEMQESTGDSPGGIVINDPEGKEHPASFAFDIVFGTSAQNVKVYENVGKPAIESTLTGYNGTIFAYGQTGSGKSWCMMGGAGENRGIIPRVNETIFERIDEETTSAPSKKFLVMCSFFEIYNEIIFDLLNPVQDRTKLGAGLQVKEHPVLGIYVKDLQEIVATDAEKLGSLMDSGTKNRAVSSTMMNATSSRSHSIFTIKVHQKDDEDKSKNVFAKLNLVDLAGSERQKGTGATGQTLKEGANINKSLSALGNVINALVENANGKKVFVPYRNSKLTRVLQESLGGNSLCTMLATLSPAACNYEETLSTLRYANRAKAIKVSATKNEEASQISRLNVEIDELKKKLAAASSGGGGGGGGGLMAEEERAEIREKFEAQLKDMQGMISTSWEETSRLSAEREKQLHKAQEEQKRQARAIEEESRKRFRLLQEQNDLELTIRGLADILQSLPSKADSSTPSATRTPLTSGDLPRQWLATAASLIESTDTLKQQQTMAVVFQGAFREDLGLWIDGGEGKDSAMARAGARRALKKMETLRKESEKLSVLEADCQSKAATFVESVEQARTEWLNTTLPAITAELRDTEGHHEDENRENTTVPESGQSERELPIHIARALEDIGSIMQLVEQQAQARSNSSSSLGALEMGTSAQLVLKGMSLVPGATMDAGSERVLRSLTEEGKEDAPPTEGGERSLHEWTAADVDGSVERTEHVLSQLVELQHLNKKRTPQELLARPPPKFVHDVAVLVRQATGFLPALSDAWPDPREEKLELLQHISDAVSSALGIGPIEFEPENVLKGKEVEKTLRLLQLLGVAAAREKNQPGGGAGSTKASRNGRTGGELTKASDMPGVLDAMGKCMEKAAQILDEQRATEASGRASPTRELENNFRTLKERLEEELQVRMKQDKRLSDLQQQLQKERTVLAERHVQLDDTRKAAGEAGNKKVELRNQVDSLRQGLLQRAGQRAAESGNTDVKRLKNELEEVAELQQAKTKAKAELAAAAKKLAQETLEADTQRETLELEVQRMKLRLAEGLDGADKLHQTEDIVMLQAEKQKLDVRLANLEEKRRAVTEADDLARKHETEVVEASREESTRNDEIQMQLQVIIEERDALREAMDQLWQEKTRVEEELENVEIGYGHLSERLQEKEEEARELEEKLQQYENLASMLLENSEKNHYSPVAPPLEPISPSKIAPPVIADTQVSPQAYPPQPPEPVPNAPQSPPQNGAIGGNNDDDASSHYSDETFEDLDEES